MQSGVNGPATPEFTLDCRKEFLVFVLLSKQTAIHKCLNPILDRHKYRSDRQGREHDNGLILDSGEPNQKAPDSADQKKVRGKNKSGQYRKKNRLLDHKR